MTISRITATAFGPGALPFTTSAMSQPGAEAGWAARQLPHLLTIPYGYATATGTIKPLVGGHAHAAFRLHFSTHGSQTSQSHILYSILTPPDPENFPRE